MRSSDLPPLPEEPKRRSREFYSGREFEYDLFWKMDVTSLAYRRELERLADRNGYVNYQNAVSLVKKFQLQDPTNPEKDFSRELRLAVEEKLGLKTPDEMDRVKIFVSINSPLDRHGVDAFITYEEGGIEYLISLDATRRGEKQIEGGKADIIVSDLADPDEDEEGYLEEINQYAEEAAEKIKEKRLEDRKQLRVSGQRGA